MGLYSVGLINGRIFASEIWEAYFREGLFLGGHIIGILRYFDNLILMTSDYCKPLVYTVVYGVDQFYPWFNFYFPLFLCMVMYDNSIKQRRIKIEPNDKIEPQHLVIYR